MMKLLPSSEDCIDFLRSSRGKWTLFLSLLFFSLLTYLYFGEKPGDHLHKIQERIDAGKPPILRHLVYVGSYYAALANTFLCLFLLVTLKWWSKPIKSSPPPPQVFPKFFLLALLLITLFGGALRYPLASKSLWWDELWNAKYGTIGYLQENPHDAETFIFKEKTWMDALWFYKKPTNHTSFTLCSKCCHLLWQKLTRQAPHQFNEFILRLPSFLSALGSIFLIGLLLARWNLPHIGLSASLLLALHPWHIRYGIDGRAYSMIIFFSLLACYALTQARTYRHWKYWILFGFCQLMLVWSHLLTIWLAGLFFLAACLLILKEFPNKIEKRTGLARLLVVNLLAGIAFLQLMGPNLLQIRQWDYIKSGKYPTLDKKELVSYLSQQAFGMLHQLGKEKEAAAIPSFEKRTASSTPYRVILISMILLLLFLGLFSLFRTYFLGGLLVSVLFGALALTILFTYVNENYFFPRFLTYGTIPFCIALTAGLFCVGNLQRSKTFSYSIPGIGIFLYILFVWPQIDLLLKRPYEPYKDIAQFFEKQVDAKKEPVLAGYGFGGRIMKMYLPSNHFLINAEELKNLCHQVAKNDQTLFLFHGHNSLNRHRLPDGYPYLDDPQYFRFITSFDGIEPQMHFKIFQYSGLPLDAKKRR